MRPATLRNAALWLIALALFATIVLDHILPAISLALNRQRYQDAAGACHEARSYLQQAVAAAALLEDEEGSADVIRRTAAVAMMDCYDRDVLRAHLLSLGVSIHALEEQDLRAKLLSEAGLTYVSVKAGE